MLRMSRLTDYGIVLLTHLAKSDEGELHNARELAAAASLPRPAVSKILKALARGGFLLSQRGAKGGYVLARPPEQISVAEVIDTLDGPIALTECGAHPGVCQQESGCQVRSPWQRVNQAIRQTLEGVSISHLVEPGEPPPIPPQTLLSVGGLPLNAQNL